MMLNLTEVDGMVVGQGLGSHRFNNKNNLCKFVTEKNAKSTKSVFAPNN